MGTSMVYMEKPNTDIEFQTGVNKKQKVQYVAAEMQGWRLNMVSPIVTIERKMRTLRISNLKRIKPSLLCLMATVVVRSQSTQRSILRSFCRRRRSSQPGITRRPSAEAFWPWTTRSIKAASNNSQR